MKAEDFIQDGKLFIRRGPGGSRFWRESDGTYRESIFVLGGSGTQTRTAEEVANILWRYNCRPVAYDIINIFGWTEVLIAFHKIQLEYHLQLPEMRRTEKLERFAYLKKEISEIKPLYEQNLHLDRQYWAAKIYEEMESRGPIDPDDFSPRRLRYGAEAKMGWVASYPKLLKELQSIEHELGINERQADESNEGPG